MAVVPRVICDVCGREDAKSYTIILDEDTLWESDLCPDHGKPFEDLMAKGWGREVRRKGRRSTFRKTDLTALLPAEERPQTTKKAPSRTRGGGRSGRNR